MDLGQTLRCTVTQIDGWIYFGYPVVENLCKLTNEEGGSNLRQVSHPLVAEARLWRMRHVGTKVPTSSQVMCEGTFVLEWSDERADSRSAAAETGEEDGGAICTSAFNERTTKGYVLKIAAGQKKCRSFGTGDRVDPAIHM